MDNTIIKIFNKWFSTVGRLAFVYDTVHSLHNPSNHIQQDRCDFYEDTHKVIFNYNLDDWVDTYHAPMQLKKWLYQNYGVKKSICTAEIIKSVGDRRVTRIQWVWLSKETPSKEMMFAIQDRILQLSETAKVQKKDLDIYRKRIFKKEFEEEPEEDKKAYVMNQNEMIEAIERGLF